MNTIRKESEHLRQEVRERMIGYIVAALGLVAGLAWNDAMKAVIEYVFPIQQDTVQAKVLYAFFITFVIVIASVLVIKIPSQTQKNEN